MIRLAESCNERQQAFGSRIPVSQTKRNRSFKMSDDRRIASSIKDGPSSTLRNAHRKTTCEPGIAESKKGKLPPKRQLESVIPQRNIETDVFDWLSKTSDNSDKYTEYCLENNTNIRSSTKEVPNTTHSRVDVENNDDLGITTEREPEMAKRSGNGKETKSYFAAIKNAFFPLEGKYFYLSGDLNNQKVSLTETTKTIGDNLGYSVDKTSGYEDKYKEILEDKRSENETKMTNKKWEINGLKDTKVYHNDQPTNTEDKGGYVRSHYGRIEDSITIPKDNMTPLKINLKFDTNSESQQKEIKRLRTQIDKLSAFVESSDERREQSEKRLAQQKEELLKHIREKEILENRVCCLEELRRNVQQRIDDISDENKSLKITLKLNEEKLVEERGRVQILENECAAEREKNVELELVLQTIREELGCVTPAKNRESSDDSFLGTRNGCDDLERDWDEGRVVVQGLDETLDDIEEPNTTRAKHSGGKKVHWGDVQTQQIEDSSQSDAEEHHWSLNTRKPRPETARQSKTQYSCLKQQASDEVLWKREKKQFEGKMMLLEMDKKKLRAQLDLVEAKIKKEEEIAQNLRESNEVLEFRILELEYELSEKGRK
ncbi:uncharacterized protein LOC114522158 [Dendronephthya gigantea]|uniref:uncharacterized protein LOC114522158 n=1 Tax=Dendronephthya gigantea TaxID=151771 RepID=UPI00106B5CA3|nr:uncharacterized protein LOC114522158 [Dendronephthya gigantea]